MRRRIGALLAALVCLATVASPSYARGPRPDRYILPGDQVFPEGVAYQQGTDNFYVSSTTDGTIFRGDLDEELTEVFLPGGSDGRTAAVGLKVDRDGRLFIAGGATGKVFVYDTDSGDLLAQFQTTRTPTFINDVTITRNGDAFFTDSQSPVLYRVFEANGTLQFEEFLSFTGTVFQYQPGFNANGIADSQNGRYLIIVQSGTGKLFRVDTETKDVIEIDLGGATVTNGDGILLRGRTLYVVRNRLGLIAEVRLSGDLSSGRVVGETTDPSFRFPTTIAIARGRLLVVNAQFDKRGPGLTPELPFTVSSVKVP